jgi:hypothetical protein
MPKIWTVSLLVALALPGQSSTHHNPAAASQAGAGALHAGYGDLQWQVMVPELGADSPQVSILRVDPKTHAHRDVHLHSPTSSTTGRAS